MATNAVTVHNVSLVEGPTSRNQNATYGDRYVYRFACSCTVDSGGANNAKITGVETVIATYTRSGRTITWQANRVQALCAKPGKDATQQVYAGNFAVSGEDLTFDVTDATGTELASNGAMTEPMNILIAVDEK